MIPNRLFSGAFRQDARVMPAHRLALDAGGGCVGWDDPMLAVRWTKVRALRLAIAAGRYDLDARLDDLLDNLPASLADLTLS